MDLEALDKYESVFRGAVKDEFVYRPLSLKQGLLITDDNPEKSRELSLVLKNFLTATGRAEQLEWEIVSGDAYGSVPELLELCARQRPRIIVTYRHLKQTHKDLPSSLGVYADMLTQSEALRDVPVMLLPYFPDKSRYDAVMKKTSAVTVIADHLTNDHDLVNYGVFFTQTGGSLYLTHIEDSRIFERYMDVISKIPDINTDTAREQIMNRLLKEPREYIASCARILAANNIDVAVTPVVRLGHALTDYKKHILNHEIDLLVMNTRDEAQMAMHGMAYSLAVELRELPLLLL